MPLHEPALVLDQNHALERIHKLAAAPCAETVPEIASTIATQPAVHLLSSVAPGPTPNAPRPPVHSQRLDCGGTGANQIPHRFVA